MAKSHDLMLVKSRRDASYSLVIPEINGLAAGDLFYEQAEEHLHPLPCNDRQ